MNAFKKVAIALAAVTVMSGITIAGQMQTGGNVPLINTMVGVGVLSLDFSSNGDYVNIATFIVNCNDAAFHVNWTMTNNGVFETVNGQTLAMDHVQVVEALATGTGGYIEGGAMARLFVTGTPEDVLTPAEVTAAADPALSGSLDNTVPGGLTWTELVMTSALVNDVIQFNASWTSDATKLYGLYLEQITYNIVAD